MLRVLRRIELVLVGLLGIAVITLVAVVGLGYLLRDTSPPTLVAPPSFPLPPTPSAPPDTPRAGSAYPVRQLDRLTKATVQESGRGNAELRYRRAVGNGTALGFSCPKCRFGTWLVETSRARPLTGDRLPRPTGYTGVLDTVTPQNRNSLLIKASAAARWTVTLTPFDALAVRSGEVRGRGATVVRLAPAKSLTVGCDSAVFAQAFSKRPDAADYTVHAGFTEDHGVVLEVPGSDVPVVLHLDCAGAWQVRPG